MSLLNDCRLNDFFFSRRYNGEEDFLDQGNYSTEILGKWAQEVVTNHDVGSPLFLMLSFQAMHLPAQVPEVRGVLEKPLT